MIPIVIPVLPTEKADRLQVSVHIQAEVLSAEAARREVNVWLLANIGNLLRAENPELVVGERLLWRIDIVLTSPKQEPVGVIGRIGLDAITGEVLADKTLIEKLSLNSGALFVE